MKGLFNLTPKFRSPDSNSKINTPKKLIVSTKFKSIKLLILLVLVKSELIEYYILGKLKLKI